MNFYTLMKPKAAHEWTETVGVQSSGPCALRLYELRIAEGKAEVEGLSAGVRSEAVDGLMTGLAGNDDGMQVRSKEDVIGWSGNFSPREGFIGMTVG